MKVYEAPEIILTSISEDVITASAGDTPLVDFEW